MTSRILLSLINLVCESLSNGFIMIETVHDENTTLKADAIVNTANQSFLSVGWIDGTTLHAGGSALF